MTLRRFAKIYLGTVALACLTLMWALFMGMVARGEWYFTLRVNDFSEAIPELLALVFIGSFATLVMWLMVTAAYTRGNVSGEGGTQMHIEHNGNVRIEGEITENASL
jgi:drug/metabolite transporter (DMT)-like permease